MGLLLEGKQEHPGWALLSKEGNWLCYAHGWHLSKNAFYAKIFGSEEQAREELKYMQEDFEGGIECDIIPAWEPLCGKLRFQVEQLEAANKLHPHDISEITFQLELIIAKLEGK